jgi:hypothetical protein
MELSAKLGIAGDQPVAVGGANGEACGHPPFIERA